MGARWGKSAKVADASAASYRINYSARRQKSDRGHVTVVESPFEPEIFDPYDSCQSRVVGKARSRALWKKLGHPLYGSFFLLCWIWGCMGWVTGSINVGVNYNDGWVYVGNLAGALVTSYVLSFSNFESLSRLFRTFEIIYLLSLVLCLLFGYTLMVANTTPMTNFFTAGSFFSIILLDAQPKVLRKSRNIQIGILCGAFVMAIQASSWTMSTNARQVIKDIVIEIPTVGSVSLIQRFLISPISVLIVFFIKNITRSFRYPKQMIVMSAHCREYSFESHEGLLGFLQARDDRLLVKMQKLSSKQSETNSKMRFLQPHGSIIIFNSRETLVRHLFGEGVAKFAWYCLKNDVLRPFLLFLNITSQYGFVFVLLGFVPQEWTLMCIPGCIAPLLGLGSSNLAKLRLLVRRFVPIYLLISSAVFVIGICAVLPDIRALCVVQMTPSFVAAILFDAQPRPMRKYGTYYFLGGIVFLLCWVVALYFELAQDLNVFKIHLPGAVVSISSVQAFLIAPITVLLPYFVRFFINSIRSPDRLPCLQTPLEEREYENLEDFVRWLGLRQKKQRQMVSSLGLDQCKKREDQKDQKEQEQEQEQEQKKEVVQTSSGQCHPGAIIVIK